MCDHTGDECAGYDQYKIRWSLPQTGTAVSSVHFDATWREWNFFTVRELRFYFQRRHTIVETICETVAEGIFQD